MKKIFYLTGFFCVLAAVAAFASEEYVAKITKVSGGVFVKTRSAPSFVRARRDLFLTSDAYIRTDRKSGAEILLKNGTMIVMKEDSMILLNDVLVKGASGRSVIGALYGSLALTVKRLAKNESVEVSSPSAVLGVRGTKFTVDALPDGSVVARVEEGAVGVSAEGEAQAVHPGEFAVASLEDRIVRKDVDPEAFAAKSRELVRRDPAVAMERIALRMEGALSNTARTAAGIDDENFIDRAGEYSLEKNAVAGLRQVSEQIRKIHPRNDTVRMYAERVNRIDARYAQLSRMIEDRLKRIDKLYEDKSREIEGRVEGVGKDLDARFEEKLKKIEDRTGGKKTR